MMEIIYRILVLIFSLILIDFDKSLQLTETQYIQSGVSTPLENPTSPPKT